MDGAVAGLLGAVIGGGLGLAGSLLQDRLSGKREREAESRRHSVELAHLKALLIGDLEALQLRARQIPGIVTSHKAANKELSGENRARCILASPEAFQAPAMGMLPPLTLGEVSGLIAAVKTHNDQMARIGGSFGDDNAGEAVKAAAEGIAARAQTVIVRLQGGNPPQIN